MSQLAYRLLNLTSAENFKYQTVAVRVAQIDYLLDRPYTCKWCGLPTAVDPADQREPPIEYCEEH